MAEGGGGLLMGRKMKYMKSIFYNIYLYRPEREWGGGHCVCVEGGARLGGGGFSMGRKTKYIISIFQSIYLYPPEKRGVGGWGWGRRGCGFGRGWFFDGQNNKIHIDANRPESGGLGVGTAGGEELGVSRWAE